VNNVQVPAHAVKTRTLNSEYRILVRARIIG